jgi:hypothetical protein
VLFKQLLENFLLLFILMLQTGVFVSKAFVACFQLLVDGLHLHYFLLLTANLLLDFSLVFLLLPRQLCGKVF